MDSYIYEIVEWIQSLSPLSIYLIFAVVAYTENVLPPLPGDVLVAFGGYLAAEQIIGFVPVLTITTVASVFGFMTMYAFGAYFGEMIETYRNRFWLMRFIDVKYYDRGKLWMNNWGQLVILLNRFLAGTRSVISIIAGVTHTKIYSTILSSTISSLIWNTVLLIFGWIVHENWQVIGHYLNIYGWFILAAIIVAILCRIIYKRGVKRKSENN